MPLIITGPYQELTAPVYRGIGTPLCRRQTGKWSPTTGWTFDQEFNSLGPSALANMQGLANIYQAAGIEYELTFQNGMAMMTTTDTSGNITIDVWEINASQITVSWLKNPVLNSHLYNIAYAASGGSGDQNVLDAWVTFFISVLTAGIANNTPGTTQPYSVTYPPGSGVTEGVFAPTKFFGASGFTWATISLSDFLPLQRAYLRALAGSDSYFSDNYTLRHTTNASNRGFYNVADVDVNRIYTQAGRSATQAPLKPRGASWPSSQGSLSGTGGGSLHSG